jgi:hypothetical protein
MYAKKGTSKNRLPRPPSPAVLRGSPLKTTVRPESDGEPLPALPRHFSSPTTTKPRGGWRLFRTIDPCSPSSPYPGRLLEDWEDDPVTSKTLKGKGRALE